MKGHRAFAALWDFATRHEGKRDAEFRRESTKGLQGKVLEIGAGVGANWEYLPDGVEYTGIEPDGYMRARAAKRSGARELIDAPAEQLPFEDGSFDGVLATLVMCSVDDQSRVLAEALRVLKPDGELRYWEHIRPQGRVSGKATDVVTPAWAWAMGGCHPNRRTRDAIKAAGFEIVREKSFRYRGAPNILGVARKPFEG